MNLLHRAKAALSVLVLLQAAVCSAAGDTPATLRATTFGPIVGNDDAAATGTLSWKGVPYARPPVGELRWRPPVDPQPWTAARETRTFGNACVQSGRPYGPGRNNRYDATIAASLGQTVGAEDCLYLNIWAPARAAGALRPVIVWVHGGSNISGYTADPVYDGANLARTADAIVVSVNYRLGIFGFLDVAQLKSGDPIADSGNFALLDLVQALRFVQANIAAFGGDPGKVTLMGQSAGAVDVYALLVSPVVTQAKPALFHRLLAISGGISTPATLPPGSIPVVVPEANFARQGGALLAQALVADGTAADDAAARAWVAAHTPGEVAAYLRGKPADALLGLVRTRLAPLGIGSSNPIPDGAVLPADPIAAIRAGRYLKVPVLAGNTRDEAKLFPTFLALSPKLGGVSGRLVDDTTALNLMFKYDPDGPAATTVEQWIPAQYLPVDAPGTGFNARTDLLNQFFFIALRNDVLDALRTRQADVWHYQFDWHLLPAPFNDIYGAAHAFDLAFVFGNFGPSLFANISYSRANQAGRLALSQAMMKSVAAFARNGDPGDASQGVSWKPWPATLVFDASATASDVHMQ
jgi:para-nitrobenzyl esterase